MASQPQAASASEAASAASGGSEHHAEIDWARGRQVPRVRRAGAAAGARSSSRHSAFVVRLVLRLHRSRRLRAGLHGRAPDRRLHGRLRARAEPVRDDLGAGAGCTCAAPTAYFDPLARRRLSAPLQPGAEQRRDAGGRTMSALPIAEVNVEAAGDLRGGRLDHPGDHLLGLQADQGRDHVLGRRPRDQRRPERLRDRRRLHVGGVVPGHRRADLPVRLRRLPVLRRLPRRLPDRALPARRADAQRRQVHDRRRALVPAERAAREDRGGARDPRGRGLLPDRADGRGRAR